MRCPKCKTVELELLIDEGINDGAYHCPNCGDTFPLDVRDIDESP